jgi:hypothetical protein
VRPLPAGGGDEPLVRFCHTLLNTSELIYLD